MDEWLWMSAGELGRGIAAGGIDPVELTEVYLSAIDAHADRDRIYSAVTPGRARAEAKAAAFRASQNLRRSPLDGVPVSWKDLFDSAGVTTEAGTALLKGRVPAHDAVVLANATALGAVCLGKTHLSEFAFSGVGLNPITATPPNRNDPKAVPGGSSSGAAASVAFGLAPLGIGSDTGGSVRIPSAWNDLVGLKTTVGRLPMGGVVPLARKFDTIGPLARSVEDCALSLALLEGSRAPDLRGVQVKGLRLATLETLVMDDIRDAPRQAFEQATARLKDAGASVEPLEAPEVAQADAMSAILYTCEAYGIWKDVIEADPDRMFRPILDRFRGGKDIAATDYVAAWERLEAYRAEWAARSAPYDAVLCPTAPILPPEVERMMSDGEYYARENLLTLRNTRMGNLFGLCALTLPTGTPSCGLMLLGKPGGEEALLRVGKAVEDALS